MPNVRKVERPAKSVKRRVDRRVGRTRARLGQALRKLMEQRPLEKISVQDVVELAGVSRSAFYAHYDDKVDLLLSDIGLPEMSGYELIKAIREHDPETARKRMYDHIVQSKHKVLRLTAPSPSRR